MRVALAATGEKDAVRADCIAQLVQARRTYPAAARALAALAEYVVARVNTADADQVLCVAVSLDITIEHVGAADGAWDSDEQVIPISRARKRHAVAA